MIVRGLCLEVVDSMSISLFGGLCAMYSLDEFNSVPRAWVVLVHVVLLAFSIGAVVAAYWRSNRPVSGLDMWIWVCGTWVVTKLALLTGSQFSETARPFIYGYIAFIWAVAAFGCSVTWMRLRSSQDRSQANRASGSQVFTALGLVLALGFVIALVLPAVPHAGEAARRTQCKNNLKQIGLAFHNFEDAKWKFPASSNDDPPHSWRIAILPFMDHKNLYDQYDFKATWNSRQNELVAKFPARFYQCPTREHLNVEKLVRDDQGRFYSHFAMIDGVGTVGTGVSPSEIVDGTNSTIMVVEACGLDILWTEPRDVNIDSQPEGINLPSPTPGMSPGWVSSHHRGGAHVLLADGSVRFLSENINPKALKSLTTIDGRDPLSEF